MTTESKLKLMDDKLNRMDDRATFIIGYRNLVNLLIIFIAAAFLTMYWNTTEGFVVGTILFVVGITRFYDQIVKNVDDLEIQDLTKKKEG